MSSRRPKTKRCTVCKRRKLRDQFYTKRSAKDKRESRCKICAKADVKRYREQNGDKVAANKQRWSETNREKVNATSRRYYWRDVSKSRAKGRLYARRYAQRHSARIKKRQHAHQRQRTEAQRRRRRMNPEKAKADNRKSAQAFRRNHPHKYKRSMRVQLLKRYGLTPDQYDALLESQNGRCAICYEPPDKRTNLAVDHCHSTGHVRMLLCWVCNTAIGKMGDDPALLERAAALLRDPPAPKILAA